MFDHDLMDEGYLGDYDSCVDLMFKYDEEEISFCKKSMNAAEYLKSWAMFTDGDTKTPDMSKKDLEKMLRAMERTLNPPIRKQKIGRNDPCPCGSGMKYKFCCMNKPKAPVDDIESPEERRRWLNGILLRGVSGYRAEYIWRIITIEIVLKQISFCISD